MISDESIKNLSYIVEKMSHFFIAEDDAHEDEKIMEDEND